MADRKMMEEIAALRREIALLKVELRGKADANPLRKRIDTIPTRPSEQQNPTKITGVQLVPAIGTQIVAKWDAANVRDVREYEIQVAEHPSMMGATSYHQGGGAVRFTLAESDADRDFYFRIRAININGRQGEWSTVRGTSPRLADTIHIQRNAATAFNAMNRVRGQFYFGTLSTENTATNPNLFEAGSLTVDFGEQTDIELSAGFTFYLQDYQALDTAKVSLRFDATEYNNSEWNNNAGATFEVVAGTVQVQIPNVASGQHRASVNVSLDDALINASHTKLEMDKLKIQLIRGKR